MNELKKLGISLGFSFLFLLISIFIVTFFNYINVFSAKSTNVFKLIFLLISLFIGGFISGKKCEKNGWLEGIKLGSIFVLFFIITSLIFHAFHAKNIIFYMMIMGSTVLGSMIGISKKEDNPKG